PKLIGDDIWKFQRLLRQAEYYTNCKKSFLSKLYLKYILYKYHKMSVRLGFTIPLNVFGPGLCIAHRGTIVVNKNAKVGKNCRIHACTNIGSNIDGVSAPQIGDNVYIGPGAKIFGDITIADNIAIGANSVVNKSFYEKGISIAGVPARKISNKGTDGFIVSDNELSHSNTPDIAAKIERSCTRY
ncbi:MAG: serine O-acetyltransferase, partial [Methanosarcina thermophila]